MASSSASSSSSSRFTSCFHHWVNQQESDLDDLVQALSSSSSSSSSTAPNDPQLRSLVGRVLRHFDDYSSRRRSLVREDPPAFFSPSWCSSFENSFLWLGGCRPTLSIRLVYAQSSSELEAHISDFLAGGAPAITGSGGLIGLSAAQLTQIDDLQQRTVREEERLTGKVAAIQEEVADKPMMQVVMDSAAKSTAGGGAENGNGGDHEEAMKVMEEYAQRLVAVLEEADGLRIRTVREIATQILTPRQAVEMLASGKQLHLAIHAWGRNRDREIKQRR